MEATTLEPLILMLTLAAASLLMVLGGQAKKTLVWKPRLPFWRRWRR